MWFASEPNQSFGNVITQYSALGYLDDIKESFVQNRRVLR
jgi:DNA mismatch repair protein MutS2